MSENNFKYDVAISVLESDLSFAKKIMKRLNKDITYFLYSERQDDLVGKDGDTFFHNVFEKESRIVVVLYRDKWGKTKWTSIEESSIKNRSYNEGQEFLIFVPLDDSKNLPIWLWKTIIWYDIKRFGIDGLVAIIEQKVKERGKILPVETLEEKSKRISDERKRKIEIKNLLNGFDGKAVKLAKKEYEYLISKIESMVSNLNNPENSYKFNIEKEYDGIIIKVSKYILCFVGWGFSGNSLTDTKLEINIKEKKFKDIRINVEYQTIAKDELVFNIDTNFNNGWSNKNNNKFNTSDNLADFWLNKLLGYIERDINNIKTYNY